MKLRPARLLSSKVTDLLTLEYLPIVGHLEAQDARDGPHHKNQTKLAANKNLVLMQAFFFLGLVLLGSLAYAAVEVNDAFRTLFFFFETKASQTLAAENGEKKLGPFWRAAPAQPRKEIFYSMTFFDMNFAKYIF
jgi:hypothetical protein